MIELLGWLIPHHVQMFFGHVNDDRRRRKSDEVSVEDVERVYEHNMLGPRGHAELADYEGRLIRVLGKELVPLALALLTETAVEDDLNPEIAEVIALELGEEGRDLPADLRIVMDVLEHDGYLVPGPTGDHQFRSGLVRDWWKRRFGRTHVSRRDREQRP